MDLTMAFLPVVSFVFVIFITIAFLATRYKRCPSDKILVVYSPSSPFSATGRPSSGR